jgi:hypothetical protein
MNNWGKTTLHQNEPLEIGANPEHEGFEAFDNGSDYNVSVSGDINIVSNKGAISTQEDGDADNYYGSSDIMFSAQGENDGWEDGYDY